MKTKATPVEGRTILDIRKYTGLNQMQFAHTYNIPLRTLQGWECDKEKSSRRPQQYIVDYLAHITGYSKNIEWQTMENLFSAEHKKKEDSP